MKSEIYFIKKKKKSKKDTLASWTSIIQSTDFNFVCIFFNPTNKNRTFITNTQDSD